MDVIGELERLVSEPRPDELLDVLTGLDDAGLRTARIWHRDVGWAMARGDADDLTFLRSSARRVCALALAVVLSSTPRDAVKRCDWRRWWVASPPEYVPTVVALLAARGKEWCGLFVRLAAQTRVTWWSDTSPEIACLCLPLIARFELPVPEADGYLQGWAELLSDCRRAAVRAPEGRDGLAPIALRDGVAHVVLPATTGLRPFLEATPGLQETLVAALRVPDLLPRLVQYDHEAKRLARTPGWQFGETLVQMAEEGLLDWGDLFVALVDALPRHSQVAVAVGVALLDDLALTPDRMRSHVPFLINVMPTLPGRATAALLPAVLQLDLDVTDLLDLGTTILSRKEKAQKLVLLKHLGARPPGDPAVDELLALAATAEDSAFAAKAQAAITKRSGRRASAAAAASPGHSISVAWGDGATGDREAPAKQRPTSPAFRPVEHAPSGVVAWYQEALHSPRIATQARLLDTLACSGADDVAALRRAVQSLPDPEWYHPWGYDQLKHWGDTGDAVMYRGRRRNPWTTLDRGLVAEVLAGVGRPTLLLSTPSREDGVLAWDDLVARLRLLDAGNEEGRVGQWDVVRALLRLELPPIERLDELHAIRKGPREHGWDVVDIVSDWVRSGGMPERRHQAQLYRVVPSWILPPESRDGADGQAAPVSDIPWQIAGSTLHPRNARGFAAPAIDVSAPLEALAWAGPTIRTAVAGLGDPVPCAEHRIGLAPQPHVMVLGVTPFAVELIAASSIDEVPGADLLPIWRASAGPFGLVVHHRLAQLLVTPNPALRAEGAATVAELAGRGCLSSALLEGRCLELFGKGEFSLTRAATAFDQAILAGAGETVWPSVSGVLEAATASFGAKPAGLADLLRVGTRYVASAVRHRPGRAVPPGVRELARAKGSSKATAEARTYCAVADAAAAEAAAGV